MSGLEFYELATSCIKLDKTVEIKYNSCAGFTASPNYYKGKLFDAFRVSWDTSQATFEKGNDKIIIQSNRVLSFKIL